MKRVWITFIVYTMLVLLVGFGIGYLGRTYQNKVEFYRGMYFVCTKVDVDRHTCRQLIGELVPYNPHEWPMPDWEWPLPEKNNEPTT